MLCWLPRSPGERERDATNGASSDRDDPKVLISTTSHLVGEFEKSHILLSLAWPGIGGQAILRWSEGPLSRTALVIAFETDPISKLPGTLIPDHSPAGDLICSYLAVLFGKRFDNHGALENQGSFYIPDLTPFTETCNQRLPQNSHEPRTNFPVPLNLAEVSRIERLLTGEAIEHQFQNPFQAASKFYLQALQAAENDPEVAYLNLITVGEILSNRYEYDEDTLLDEEIRNFLDIIRDKCPQGARIAKCISGRLRQVKRRFIETLVKLCDSSFFDRPEATAEHGLLKPDSFRDSVAAAYDLRSRYVHTGTPFGAWICPNSNPYETQYGLPVTGDKELGKILAKAPTYIGLERVTRHALLRFAQSNGAYVEPNISGSDETG
jgi:hypothetical protein